MSQNGARALVELQDLKLYFQIKSGIVLDRHVGDIKAVDGVSFEIRRGPGTAGAAGDGAAAGRRPVAGAGTGLPDDGRHALVAAQPDARLRPAAGRVRPAGHAVA